MLKRKVKAGKYILTVAEFQQGWTQLNGQRKPKILSCGEILLTSMDADGTKNGYDIPLTKAISEAVNIPVIASGGAGNAEHIYEALTKGKADAALAASIFHYRTFNKEGKEYLRSKNVSVRL